MAAAYIEHRPLASDRRAGTTHHAAVANGSEIAQFKTQKEAADWAKALGYQPIHVARERHLQNRDRPPIIGGITLGSGGSVRVCRE